MYSRTEIEKFRTAVKPLLDLGVITEELFNVALNAVRDNLTVSASQVESLAEDKLVSRKEVAKMLGKSTKTIDRMRKDGSLRCAKIRSSVMFKKSDILAIMNSYENTGGGDA